MSTQQRDTTASHTLDTFVGDVTAVVSASDDEHQVTQRVAEPLSALLAGGYRSWP